MAHPVRQGRRKRRLILLLFLAVFLGIGLARYRGPERTPKETIPSRSTADWQTCLTPGKGDQPKPEMIEIPDGEYNMGRLSPSSTIQTLLVAADLTRILVKKPYFIQKRTVTQEEFALYVATVKTLPDGEEKSRLMIQIGLHWQKPTSAPSDHSFLTGRLFGSKTETPLQTVSWEAAQGYAEWISNRSGCKFHLPSREEWAAALMYLHESPMQEEAGVPNADAVRHNLLRGVQEWTRSPCSGGYYLAGGDATRQTNDGTGGWGCMPAMVSIAGFRLVLKINAPTDRQTTPPTPVKPENRLQGTQESIR
ncbi:MAG: SUMF1/EgtB/PvdO family nonheme iron enzyme [Magnetococcus sp. DMHC-1]